MLQSHILPKASATGNQRPNTRWPFHLTQHHCTDATVNATAVFAAAVEVCSIYWHQSEESTWSLCFEQPVRKCREG